MDVAAHLDIFEKAVKYQMSRFGLLSYDVTVAYDAKLPHHAHIFVEPEARTVHAVLGKVEKGPYGSKEEAIEDIALHECCHALVGELSSLARSRYAREEEIDRVEEALVVTLTKLLREPSS